MAKQKIGSDELNLDNEIDIPSFDFNFGDVPDDRTPAEQILTGIRKGVTGSFRNTGFIRRLLRESLPPVYGEIEDTYNLVENNTSQLYNKAVREVKPSIAHVAKATHNLIPEKFKRSKDTLKMIKEWAEGYKPATVDKEGIRSRNIAIEIGDVFSGMARNQEEQYKETQAKDAIKESIDIVRHKETRSIFSDINRGVQTLAMYQDKVTQAYQKKSLELQYRSYFAQVDSLEETKRLVSLSETSFKAIAKNTALPEFVKIRDSERFKELLKDKMTESLFGTTQAFFAKTFKNTGTKLKEYTDIFKDAAGLAASGMETADMGEMGGVPGGWRETLATQGAEVAIQQAGLKVGRGIRGGLNKIPGVRRKADDAQYALSNLPEMAQQWTNNTDFMDPWWKSGFKSVLKDLIGNQRPDASIQTDSLGNGMVPTPFTNRNSKSLNEIIPGYLARILREIQVFRTGDESIGLTAYDPYKNKFEGSDAVKKSFLDKLITRGSLATHQDTKEDIFKLVDPKGELSAEQRNAVMDILTNQKFNKKLLSPNKLSNKSFYSNNDSSMSEEDSAQVAGVFEKYFSKQWGKNGNNDKRNALNRITSRIGRSLNNPSAEIQRLVNMGYSEQLREMGFLNEEGTAVNMDEVLKKFQQKSDVDPKASIEQTIAASKKPSFNRSTLSAQATDPNIEETISRITDRLSENSESLKQFLNLHKDNQKEFSGFIKDNVETLTKLDESLVGLSVKDEVKNTNSILQRIEDYLVSKLPVLMMQKAQGEGHVDPTLDGYRKDTFFNNLTGVMGKAGGAAWSKFIKPVNKFAWGATKLGVKLSAKSLGLAGRTLHKSSNWLTNKVVKAKDIFVEGEEKPRMKMTGFRAGKYFDSKSNEPIKSIHDLEKLEGDVIDDSGNIVLSKDEFDKAYVKDIKGSGILKLGKFFTGKVIDFGKFTSGQAIGGMKMLFGAANWARKTAMNLLDQPIDIYVKGDTEPTLLATVMRNGGYLSERTGQPITRPSEIDGPLKDSKGNYALTTEQLKKGIEDINGKPIKTPMMKLLGLGLGIIGAGVKGVFRASKFVTDAMKGGLNQTGNFFQGMLDALNGGTGGKKSIEVLEQIRNILDKRLPNEKQAFNDKNGDGKRDGSWQDLQDDEEGGNNSSDRVDTTVDTGRENTFDRLERLAGNAKNKVLGLLGLGGDDEEGGVDIDVTTGEPSKGNRRRRRRKPKGLLGKAGGLLRGKGALGLLGSILGGVGKFGLKGLGLLGKGGIGLLAKGLPLLGSAVGAAGAAIPAILGGIGAVVSSPIFLGAVAVGAVAYGGFKAYQYFTKKEYTNLVKLRMAQYGLSIDQMKQYPMVMALEDKMTKYVNVTETGVDFNVDDVLVTELLKLFEINPEDTKPKNVLLIEKWIRWFSTRFKSVYSAHMSALNKMSVKTPITDIDSLNGKDKITYIGIVRNATVPYGDLTSPFVDAKLEAGEQLAEAYAERALEEANEQAKKDEKDPSKMSKEKTAVEGALAASGAAAALTSVDNAKAKSDATPSNAPAQAGWFATKLQQTLNILKSPFTALAMVSPFAALAGFAIKNIGGSVLDFFGFSVTALEAVRFKTYGLREMERSKVSSIRKLEKELLDKVTFNGEGLAFYNESAEYVLSKVGAEFGITDTNSPNTSKWMTWFQQRFLPVYLNYIGLVKQAGGGSGKASLEESRLGEQMKLEIANKLVSTLGVWVVTASPWLGYDSNTDSSLTKENISYLEKQAKDKKLAEQKDTSAAKATTAIQQANGTVGANASVPGAAASAGPNGTTVTPKPVPDSSAEKTGSWNRLPGAVDKKPEPTRFQAGNKLAKPGSFQGFGDDIDGYIRDASMKYGIDEATLRGFVKMEAGWGNQKSYTGAIGVGQFTQGTWDALAKTPEGKEIGMTVIGKRFRSPEDPRYDKRINTLATGLLAKQNADLLKKRGVEPTGENLYMVHNIGPGFIDAITGGNVNQATRRAMELNGMKGGMTPEQFVEFQKGRFNKHYEAANGAANAVQAMTGQQSKPANVGTAQGPKEAIDVYNASKARTPSAPQQTPSTPAMSSYAGSVEKTKPNPSAGNVPQFRGGKLPEEADEFAAAMKRNREMFSRRTTQPVDPQIIASTQLNNSVNTMTNILSDSLSVQKQMAGTLQEILVTVGKVASNKGTPKEEPKQEPPSMSTASARQPHSRKMESLPRAPIATARG